MKVQIIYRGLLSSVLGILDGGTVSTNGTWQPSPAIGMLGGVLPLLTQSVQFRLVAHQWHSEDRRRLPRPDEIGVAALGRGGTPPRLVRSKLPRVHSSEVGRGLGRGEELEPALEHLPPVRPQLVRMGPELGRRARSPSPARARASSASAYSGTRRPLGGHLAGELEMELDAVGTPTPAERLVRVGRRAREQHRAFRKRERVAVPLKGEELAREAGEDRVGGRSLGEEHGQEPDLRRRAGNDLGAEARGEELNAEAGAEEGQAGADRLARSESSRPKPGKLLLVVDAHRAAHRNDRVEFAPVGERLAFVELDAVDPGAALDQDVLVDAGRLAGDVLEDERLTLSRLSPSPRRRARTCSRPCPRARPG